MTDSLPPKVRRRVWLRQFLLQGCWNYGGMQNVGFAYSILPALRSIYRDRPEEFLRAVRRHLEFFNTHPVMASVILGASLRLEERVARGETDPRAVGTFKVGLMGSLGAIGDSYFWGALRPMASAAGALLALIHPLLGILALLALYNLSQIPLRRRAFRAGEGGEESAARFLREAGFTVRTEDRKMVAAVLGGAFAGTAGSRLAHFAGTPMAGVGVFLVAAAAVHLFTGLYRKAVSPSEILFLMLLLGALMLWQ